MSGKVAQKLRLSLKESESNYQIETNEAGVAILISNRHQTIINKEDHYNILVE